MSQNHLSQETSPYLLQHKDNPVHWWAWGQEALAKAKAQNKPILLSVGYAACHWCHVMAHESFEDQETADLMNELFINIKVDREERPDIDTIYMQALHKMGEQGGWPLTMFLTPDAKPFWGGTYFPPEAKYGRPSFKAVLQEVSRIYNEEHHHVLNNTTVILKHLKHKSVPASEDIITNEKLIKIANTITNIIDFEKGGIQGQPKFPQGPLFEFLWNVGVLYDDQKIKDAVTITLTNICQGGIYDHLGGGIARYSVDDKWLVPHFEKMLYDNAQLITLMTSVWQETKDPLLKQRTYETCEWVLREMLAEHDGFASAIDADSEGVEGKYYIWSKSEIYDVLGPDKGDEFCNIYGVSEAGNFEGENILNRLEAKKILEDGIENSLQSSRNRLLSSRTSRIYPSWDDKILSDWNGLMISALSHAGYIFDQPHWIEASIKAYECISNYLIIDNRMYHAYRKGHVKGPATASDYANMIEASLTLFEITSSNSYLEDAINWSMIIHTHYWDGDSGGYFLTADDTNDVIVRTRSAMDEATPSANAVMAINLSKLFMLTGNADYKSRAEKIIRAFSNEALKNLFAHTKLFSAWIYLSSPILIRTTGPDTEQMQTFLATLKNGKIPGSIIILPENKLATEKLPQMSDQKITDEEPSIYICTDNSCMPPIATKEELEQTLDKIKSRLTHQTRPDT